MTEYYFMRDFADKSYLMPKPVPVPNYGFRVEVHDAVGMVLYPAHPHPLAANLDQQVRK